jgi:trigger factor
VIEYFRENRDAQRSLQAPIFEEKVVDFIVEMAQVTDREVAVDELTTAAAGSDD